MGLKGDKKEDSKRYDKITHTFLCHIPFEEFRPEAHPCGKTITSILFDRVE